MAMQVIYSAGTTSPMGSPRPSPRSSPMPVCRVPKSPHMHPHGVEGWRPVMPGYRPPTQHSVTIHNTMEIKHSPDSDTTLKDTIPALSRSVAIICFICNILLPGLGTFISGLTVLCCSKVRARGGTKMNVIWVNTWVALLQFLTAFLFLLGWIWSIMWGATFLSIAEECRKEKEQQNTNIESSTSEGDESTAVLRARARQTQNASSVNNTSTRNLTVNCNDDDNIPSSPGAPIIVLQEAPVIVQPGAFLNVFTLGGHPTGGAVHCLNPYNRYHRRIMRRQIENSVVPPIQLSAIQLQQIVPNVDEHDDEHDYHK